MVKVQSLILQGITGKSVVVESHWSPGLQKLSMVGLPDRSVSEAKERIQGAILASGLKFPYGRVVVNLSPAEFSKHGTHLDLAICLSVLLLKHESQIKLDLTRTVVLGEVGLDGCVKVCKGLSTLILEAEQLGYSNFIIPKVQNPVYLKPGHNVYTVDNIADMLEYIDGRPPVHMGVGCKYIKKLQAEASSEELEYSQILNSRPYDARVMAIAAAGRHNLLLDGAPGCGKTTLLKSFSFLLPALDEKEQILVYKLHSLVSDKSIDSYINPPQRNPHNSISQAALTGGGWPVKPGEVSLANLGVLFLDEIAEFSRTKLESLRQPCSDKSITVQRSNYRVQFPADFQLIATRNPCPCGWYGDTTHICTCSDYKVKSYQHKLSGAILDRIDIKYRVEKVPNPILPHKNSVVDSLQQWKQKISNARSISKLRSQTTPVLDNSGMETNMQKLLVSIYEKGECTLRGMYKLAGLARTIADLDGKTKVGESELYEAINLNNLSSLSYEDK